MLAAPDQQGAANSLGHTVGNDTLIDVDGNYIFGGAGADVYRPGRVGGLIYEWVISLWAWAFVARFASNWLELQ